MSTSTSRDAPRFPCPCTPCSSRLPPLTQTQKVIREHVKAERRVREQAERSTAAQSIPRKAFVLSEAPSDMPTSEDLLAGGRSRKRRRTGSRPVGSDSDEDDAGVSSVVDDEREFSYEATYGEDLGGLGEAVDGGIANIDQEGIAGANFELFDANVDQMDIDGFDENTRPSPPQSTVQDKAAARPADAKRARHQDSSTEDDEEEDETDGERTDRHMARLIRVFNKMRMSEKPEQAADLDERGRAALRDMELNSDEEDRARSLSPEFEDDELEDDPFLRDIEEDEDFEDDPEDDPEEPIDASADSSLPRAFREHPRLRYAYISAFIQSVYHQATDGAISHQLRSRRTDLTAYPEGVPVEQIKAMAVTRRAVEKRLGVSAEPHLMYFFVCSVCWELHPLSELNDIASPDCATPDCTGQLYTIKKLSEKRSRRVPTKLLPMHSIIGAIQRLVLRPGKYDALGNVFEHLRGDDREAAPLVLPPSNSPEDAFRSLSVRLHDIGDGYGLGSLSADLVRTEVPQAQDANRVRDSPRPGRTHARRFVCLPCGLVLIINIDWFQPMKKSTHGKHSTGAVFVMLANNPGTLRYLPGEMFLVAVIPGPDEPTTEQLNKILEPLVDELIRLYEGVEMHVAGHAEKQPVNAALYMNTSDLPASRKISGMRGHAAEDWMCTLCDVTFSSITHARCFDRRKLNLRDDWRFLKYAYRSRKMDDAAQKEIWERRGVQWSELDRLPSWLPATNSVLDLLHGGFLAMVKHILRGIYIKGGLFTPMRDDDEGPLKRLEDALGSIVWPSSIGRIPNKLSNISKGDHYRNVAAVLPILLYCAFQVDGDVPNSDAPLPRSSTNAAKELTRIEALFNTRRVKDIVALHGAQAATEDDINHAIENPVSMSRNIRRHYDCTLDALSGLRILGSRSISPGEAQRAEDILSGACKTWTDMYCSLTPYFHLISMHACATILRFGPLPSYWLFGTERANGKLTRFRTNGRDGGQLEATLMRSWTKTQLIHELVERLSSLEDESPLDAAALSELKEYIDGEDSKSRKGVHKALVDMLAQRAAEKNGAAPGPSPACQLSRKSKVVSILKLGLYNLVFQHVQTLWMNDVNLVHRNAIANIDRREEVFGGLNVRSHHYVVANARHFGAYNSYHGRGMSYAYIDGRKAVRIQRILHITHIRPNLQQPLTTTVAVVSRFIAGEGMPLMPWDLRGTDNGYHLWRADEDAFKVFEIIPVHRLTGHFALIPGVPLGRNAPVREAWVTVSMDRWNSEPDPLPLDENGDWYVDPDDA